MNIKRRVQRLSIWLTYHFSCLQSHEHIMRRFRREYRLHEEIGRGGFGIVYRGFRLADDAPVAVKFVAHKYVREWIRQTDNSSAAPKVKANGGGQLLPAEMRYLQECADIDGVVNLIDWFASSKGFLMVMERPNNCMDLFDVISVYGRLDEEIARRIFKQIVDTVVQLLQKHSIVHRDIKDENVIVDMETGTIRLVDFGAADYLEMARIKEFQGTKSYCPPEWFKRNCYLPLESTVWSLGVLLYIMLTGNNPFKSEIQICVGRPKFPNYVSPKSQDLIKRCLNPSPERRLALEEILQHEFFLEEESVLEKRCSTSEGSAASGSFRQRRRRPFHALLHRRSMRRRRRRDCDVNTSPSDEFDSESSLEAECSYRQSMIQSELRNQPAPITVPQYAIEAAASKNKTLPRQETAENSVYFTTDELDEDCLYLKTILPLTQESSSGFETAAEEPDEWPALPMDDSVADSIGDSFSFCRNPQTEARRQQLLQIHHQKRVEQRRPPLVPGVSQSSYKSAVSQIVPCRRDDASGESILLTSSSSGACSSEDENSGVGRVTTFCPVADTIVETDQSSVNLYFSAVEKGAKRLLCSQPSTEFWSASDADQDYVEETLKNDISNSVDITVVIEDSESSTNDVAEVGEDGFLADDPSLFLSFSTDIGRDAVTPTVLDENCVTPSPASPLLSVCDKQSPCNAPKSSTISPPMQRRSKRRLSRRLRDATRHTPSGMDSRSSSSDSSSAPSLSRLSAERRERSVPASGPHGVESTVVGAARGAAQSGSRYRRRWRDSFKQHELLPMELKRTNIYC